MTGPVFSDYDVSDLAAISDAGMGFIARRWISDQQRLPNGEYVSTPHLGPPVSCHLKNVNKTQAEVAAAQGFEAQWSLKVPNETVIPAESVWQVSDDCGWIETVRVTGDLVKHGRVMRLVAAVDTTLNKS